MHCEASSAMSASLWEMPLLELVPVSVSENISLWEGVLVSWGTIFLVILEFISLWEGVWMSEWAMLFVVVLSLLWAWNWPNGTVGRVSSVWWHSLGLITADRLPPRSWFKSLSALPSDNSIGISMSGSPALMAHLGGCGLVLLAGMVLTLGPLQTSSASWAWWHSSVDTVCLWNIRVESNISNAFDFNLWYRFQKIFHFGRVLLVMVLKGNILLVIVRIFHFGRVFRSQKMVFCYFTLGGCWGLASNISWYYWYIMAPWLEMGPVPPQWCSLMCQDIIASPSVCCTSNCANLPFILPSACWSFARFALSWLFEYLCWVSWYTVPRMGSSLIVSLNLAIQVLLKAM